MAIVKAHKRKRKNGVAVVKQHSRKVVRQHAKGYGIPGDKFVGISEHNSDNSETDMVGKIKPKRGKVHTFKNAEIEK